MRDPSANSSTQERRRPVPIRIENDELRRLLGSGAQLVDVLPEAEYEEAHLPGALSIPLVRLDGTTAARLDKAAPVAVYCNDYL